MHGAVNAIVVSWGAEGNKNFRVLAVCRECTDAWLKNIQIQAQKCAGWRLSDWKDFLEDAKSTFLPPFAAHSFNNNANWVSVILDPVSYLQDQNGHSMLFPSQAWHLRVRFHEMTGLWNPFFCDSKGNFSSQKVFPFTCKWTLESLMTRHTTFPRCRTTGVVIVDRETSMKSILLPLPTAKSRTKDSPVRRTIKHSVTINNSRKEAAQMVTKR